MKKEEINYGAYASYYNENGFWSKLKSFALKIGAKGVYMALQLYYALRSDKVSPAQRTIIIGALGYFILPLDFIPDFLPGGFTDDLAALSAALLALGSAIDDNIRQQAKDKMCDWFGETAVERLK